MRCFTPFNMTMWSIGFIDHRTVRILLNMTMWGIGFIDHRAVYILPYKKTTNSMKTCG